MSIAPASTPAAERSLAGKYLTVVLDREAYGLAVLQIREIIRLQKITAVPRLPACVKGVINLRGRVIPVTDLRARLGLAAAVGERTCIVVVQIGAAGARGAQMGLIVDSVEEVVTIAATDIEPTPEFGTAVDTTCLLGLAKVKGQVKTLLDLERILGTSGLPAAA